MAKIRELDNEAWMEWVATRPPEVQALCSRFPPNRLYRMKSTGHRVTLYSYSEDGTVTVNVTGEYNAVVFGRRVFGISPDDLEECELPRDEEITGQLLTDESDMLEFINARMGTCVKCGKSGMCYEIPIDPEAYRKVMGKKDDPVSR